MEKTDLGKRNTLKGLAAAAGVSTFAIGGRAKAQGAVLKIHQMLPEPATIPSKAIKPWIEKVQSESQGRLKLEMYSSMQLGGKPPELYNQAEDGVVDLVWTVLGYSPGRFKKSEVFELPFMTADPVQGSRAFHEYVEANALEEFSSVKPIAFHIHGPGWIHTSKPVNTIDDLKGMKLRGPTRIVNSMLEKLGSTPVGMPIPAVPEALSKGVVDGTVIPWEVTAPLKISELVKNHSGFAEAPGLYTATFGFVMNKAKYEGLPDDLKAIIDKNSGAETAAMFGQAMKDGDVTGEKLAKDAGNTIITLDGERDKWQAITDEVAKEWVAEMGSEGEALLAAAREAIAKNSQ